MKTSFGGLERRRGAGRAQPVRLCNSRTTTVSNRGRGPTVPVERTTAHCSLWLRWVIRSTNESHSGERFPRLSHCFAQKSLDWRDAGARLDFILTAAGCVRPTTLSSLPLAHPPPPRLPDWAESPSPMARGPDLRRLSRSIGLPNVHPAASKNPCGEARPKRRWGPRPEGRVAM